MKKFGFVLSLALVTTLLGSSAFAQKKGDNSYYFVTYFSNANTKGAPDQVLRLVNDGDASTANTTGAPDQVLRLDGGDASTSQTAGVPNGVMGAEILVFDDSQELQECCGCLISADGLLSESVNNELTANTLTNRGPLTRGVIKIIGVSLASGNLAPGLRGTMTHTQATTLGPNANQLYTVTESPLADSNLVSAELSALEQSCSFTFTLGSGTGICSCTPEGADF